LEVERHTVKADRDHPVCFLYIWIHRQRIYDTARLVGDSLTEHQGQVLITMFGRDITDGLLQMTSGGMWENGINLVPTHPEIPSLLAEAGVTEDRLQTPLIKFWRHHHVATDEEKAQAFAFAGDRYSLNPDRENGKSWYEPMIEQATRTEVFMRPDSEALEEPTMIVLNLGAHLVWYELGKELTPLDYLEGLENIVSVCVVPQVERSGRTDAFVDHGTCAAATGQHDGGETEERTDSPIARDQDDGAWTCRLCYSVAT
jgi:hypothetical protein